MLQLTIKFKGLEDTEINIESPLYIPNIGESVHNSKECSCYFYVTSKETFIYPDIAHCHVIIKCVASYIIDTNNFTKQIPII